MMKSEDRFFTRRRLEDILKTVVGKTLGEVDASNQFARTARIPKITGIAGDVIELSVLGCSRDASQEPDIVVDGISIELKTTGIQKTKGNAGLYEAKEPMSITAVGIDTICGQTFETSHFYKKIEHLLLVFYLYERIANAKVYAADYARFIIMGYRFHEFEDNSLAIIRNDWQLVHDFIADIQSKYESEEERRKHYPLLSSALRHELLVLDTAPKYPHPPRFRFKRVFVTTIIQQHFNEHGNPLVKLKHPLTKYAEIDEKCHRLAEKHKGKTAEELFAELGLFSPDDLMMKHYAAAG